MALQIEKPYAPIEQIHWKEAAEKGIHLFLKREDLSHPFISGNKWRKLKYHLLQAEAEHKNLLVTYGGPYSNHLLATAAAGAKYGFKTIGIVRGEEVKNLPLTLCKTLGMQLQFISREPYKLKQSYFQSHFGSNPNAYEIPEGGAGALGELGVAELITENVTDEYWEVGGNDNTIKIKFDHLFASVGTGSTLRGLIKGVTENDIKTRVHGVVVLKGAEAMQSEFEMLDPVLFQLHHRFHGGGYAKVDAHLKSFINKFASHTGILLDQVYEAKMMLGILTLVEEDFFKPGTNILAFHNGGLIGLSGLLN